MTQLNDLHFVSYIHQSFIFIRKIIINYKFTYLNTFFVKSTFYNSIHINSRQVNLIRIQLACFNNFFNFRYSNFSSFTHNWIKIPSCFSKYQIPRFVSFPSLYQRKISSYCCFENVISTIEFLSISGIARNFWLACFIIFYNYISLLNYSSETCGGVKSRDTSSSCSYTFC